MYINEALMASNALLLVGILKTSPKLWPSLKRSFK